jgi:hypothetical protein
MQRERRQSSDAREVHAIQQEGEFLLRQLDRDGIAGRPLELATLQSLVPYRESCSIPSNRFEPVRPLAAKQKYIARERITAERLGDGGAQPIERAARMRCTAFAQVCPAVCYAELIAAQRPSRSQTSMSCGEHVILIALHNDDLRKPPLWRHSENQHEELDMAI